MLVNTISTIVNSLNNTTIVENYNGGGMNLQKHSTGEIFTAIVTLVIVYIIILILGKYLWNHILIKLIPGIKPAHNIWQILGLSILLSLLFNK